MRYNRIQREAWQTSDVLSIFILFTHAVIATSTFRITSSIFSAVFGKRFINSPTSRLVPASAACRIRYIFSVARRQASHDGENFHHIIRDAKDRCFVTAGAGKASLSPW